MWTELTRGSGAWWHFDRYEVAEGIVRPAPGAVLARYDPWPRAAGEGDGKDAMLFDLLTIGKMCSRESAGWGAGTGTVPEGVEGLVLDWCGRYGLLGLWQHQFVAAFLAPQRDGGRHRIMVNHRVGHFSVRTSYQNEIPAPRQGRALWSLLPRKFFGSVRDEWTRIDDPPGAARRGRWASFFPGVPGDELTRRHYGTPYRVRFWQMYGEPLEDFLSAALLLRDLAVWMASFEHIDEQLWAASIGCVQALLRGLHPVIVVAPGGRPGVNWGGISLLSVLAGAICLPRPDESKRPIECEVCGKWILASRPHSRYCSPRCRKRAQMRNYRAKLREKAEKA